MIKTYRAHLKSNSIIQFSKNHETAKLEKETPKAYDERTWREKAHVNEEGYVIIPQIMFKNSLYEVAKYLGIRTKGKETFTKHFQAGVMVIDSLVTPVKKEDLAHVKVFCQMPGSAKIRVWKTFPILNSWEGDVDYTVTDQVITKAALLEHLIACGQFQGLGSWRPRNGGLYGRFSVKSLEEI